jgi:hypothetical protein
MAIEEATGSPMTGSSSSLGRGLLRTRGPPRRLGLYRQGRSLLLHWRTSDTDKIYGRMRMAQHTLAQGVSPVHLVLEARLYGRLSAAGFKEIHRNRKKSTAGTASGSGAGRNNTNSPRETCNLDRWCCKLLPGRNGVFLHRASNNGCLNLGHVGGV